jgi:hypothetical protein
MGVGVWWSTSGSEIRVELDKIISGMHTKEPTLRNLVVAWRLAMPVNLQRFGTPS